MTDYSVPQSIVDSKHIFLPVWKGRSSTHDIYYPLDLYDQCAVAGYQLPILTFPGQNSTRPLSSVVLPSSSPTVVSESAVSFTPSSAIQSVGSGPTTAATTTSTQAPIPTPSLSSGIRSVETGYFNLFAVAMLGTWFYFVRIDRLLVSGHLILIL